MGNLSYLNDTHIWSLSDPAMKPPHWRGFKIGNATLTLIKKLISSFLCFHPTSSTSPNLLPTCFATYGEIISNGAPHIWTQSKAFSICIFPIFIPFFHHCSMRSWLSNDQGPSLSIQVMSNSDWNLNWKRFGPTSRICIESSNPHALLNVFFAASC